MSRKSNKTQFNIRLSPGAKKAAYKMAREQHRTLSATIEILIVQASIAAEEKKEGNGAAAEVGTMKWSEASLERALNG